MMDEFMQLYEQFRGSRPMNMSIKEIKAGIRRWRIHIFEKGTAPTGGDRELLFAEDPSKEKCLQKAINIMRRRMEHEQKAEKEAV